jgi:hypothetical protein
MGSGRYRLGLVLPLLLFLAACSPQPVFELHEPERVDTCDELVLIGVQLVSDYMTTLEARPDAAGALEDGDPWPELDELDARGADLDSRAAALGCDPVVLNAAIAAGTESIEATTPVARLFLETVQRGIVAGLPEAPATTTTTATGG